MRAEQMQETPYTKQTGIFIIRVKVGSRSFWRHIDCNDQRYAQVGEQYSTKAELLVDHYDYLRRAGWLAAPEKPESVVYSATEAAMNDGAGFWSNRFGWVDCECASLFSHEEVSSFSLPLSTGNDAVFVPASEASHHRG